MRKKCMKVASNDNNHQIEERKSRSPPQVLNLFLFVGYLIRKKNYSHFFNDKAYSRGFISSHCHSFLNKSPLPRVCYPKEICSIFFGPDSLVIIIIGGPMKLRTFVGPKGPFTDGQRWKLVLVQSLLPHILGSQSYFHCVH